LKQLHQPHPNVFKLEGPVRISANPQSFFCMCYCLSPLSEIKDWHLCERDWKSTRRKWWPQLRIFSTEANLHQVCRNRTVRFDWQHSSWQPCDQLAGIYSFGWGIESDRSIILRDGSKKR